MTADVIVLGAGIVGVSTALALRQRGHGVVLVDRSSSCQETSYGNAGIIQREAVRPYAFPRNWRTLLRVASGRANEAHYHLGELLRLAPRLARYWANSATTPYRRIAEAYGQFISHCISEHATWISESGADDLVSRNGWQQAFRTPALMEAAAAEARLLAEEHGLDFELLDAGGLARTQPSLRIPMAGAVHWKDPWTVRAPGELVDQYAALFVRMGGKCTVGDALTLHARRSGWSVETSSGVMDALHAVIALGPWSGQLTRKLGYRLPLFIKRGYHRHYTGGASLQLPLLDTENGVMLAPMKRGIRISTGAEFAAHDAAATPVQLIRAETSTRKLLDLGYPVEPQPWIGARPCTVDMMPIIGRAPNHHGLWFNFGHGHQGFTLGPASGRLLAELISGEQTYLDPAPYSPRRF